MAGGLMLLFFAGVVGAEWQGSASRVDGERDSGLLLLALGLGAVGQLLAMVGVVATGVRMGIEAARARAQH